MSVTSSYAKMINMIIKFISGKQEELPLFHGNDIPEFIKAKADTSLKRDTPGKHNISKKNMDAFIDTLCGDYSINPSQIGIMVDGVVVREHYVKPYTGDYRHVSFSVCKSILSMAVGIAVDRGILRLDEKLSDIFPEKDSIFFKKNIKNVTVEHLLTMTACVSFDEVSSYFDMDWQKSFMASDIDGNCGVDFYYNSLNSYMLAAIISKKTNQTLTDYLQENIFSYLGISDITWDKCPMGMEKGGWGMKLSLIDMLKLGQLVLDKGCVLTGDTSKQLISRKWIEEATKAKVKIDCNSVIDGYGYHIWILKDGSYLFNGLFGQNVYINPSRNMVIAIFASSYAIFPDEKLVGSLINYAANDNNFVKDKDNIFDNIVSSFKINNLKKNKNLFPNKYDTDNTDIKNFVLPWLSKEYFFKEYAGSVLPLASQIMYSNYSGGVVSIKADIKENTLIFYITEKKDNHYTLYFDINDDAIYRYQVLLIGGKEMPIATKAQVLRDEYNRKYLSLNICYLEEVSDRFIMLFFEDNKLIVKMVETPNISVVINKLLEETPVFKSKNKSKHDIPDYVKYKFENIVCPRSVGEECV